MNLLSSLLLLSLGVAEPGTPGIELTACNFGEVYAFHSAQCHMQVRNTESRSVAVALRAEHPGDRISPESIDIPAHSNADVEIEVDVGNDSGDIVRFFRVRRLGSDVKDQYARASGFGMSSLDDPEPRVDFGTVKVDAEIAERNISLGSHDAPHFRIKEIISEPAALDVSLADATTLRMRVRNDADWGLLDDFVKVAVESPPQSEVWVAVKADVQGSIVPSSNPVWLGVVRPGEKRVASIQLKSISGQTFKVGELKFINMEGAAKITECELRMAGCKELHLNISQTQPAGSLKGAKAS